MRAAPTEIGWTLLAAIGCFAWLWNLRDSWTDWRTAVDYEAHMRSKRIAKGYLWDAGVWILIFVNFMLLGAFSMVSPPNPSPAALGVKIVAPIAFFAISLVGIYLALRKRWDRLQILTSIRRHRLANDAAAARLQAELKARKEAQS